MRETGIGTGLILIAIGAILAFAVDFQTTGIDINAIGAILIVVGLIGLLFSFIALGESTAFWGRTSGYTGHYVDSNATAPHTHQRVEETDVVVEDDRTGTVERVERVRRVR